MMKKDQIYKLNDKIFISIGSIATEYKIPYMTLLNQINSKGGLCGSGNRRVKTSIGVISNILLSEIKSN